MGLGKISRHGAEQCWYVTRGKGLPGMREAFDVPQVLFNERREHSRKPDEIADEIARLFPKPRNMELFARTRRAGWLAYGNQVDNFK
jgi:N6-adenosine-specific RNA methylase IME4